MVTIEEANKIRDMDKEIMKGIDFKDKCINFTTGPECHYGNGMLKCDTCGHYEAKLTVNEIRESCKNYDEYDQVISCHNGDGTLKCKCANYKAKEEEPPLINAFYGGGFQYYIESVLVDIMEEMRKQVSPNDAFELISDFYLDLLGESEK